MATISRRPCPELTPWIERIWASSPGARSGDHIHGQHARTALTERVLPTGTTHVVWREATTPLTLLTDQGQTQSILSSQGIIGGIRSAPYNKRLSHDAATVGVQLKPGGAQVLLGLPAVELAERHSSLEAVWGRDATDLQEQLYATSRAARADDPLSEQHRQLARLHNQLSTLEASLLARVRHLDIDPARQRWIEHCASNLQRQVPLARLVQETGLSHRTFITRFRSAVGLAPKVYARILRFQRLIQAIANPVEGRDARAAARNPRLAELAVEAGFSDQAHLSRDFREFTGLSPTEYLRLAPVLPNHVLLRG